LFFDFERRRDEKKGSLFYAEDALDEGDGEVDRQRPEHVAHPRLLQYEKNMKLCVCRVVLRNGAYPEGEVS
jgi:hypothetical protein